jgi:hypothetical protein
MRAPLPNVRNNRPIFRLHTALGFCGHLIDAVGQVITQMVEIRLQRPPTHNSSAGGKPGSLRQGTYSRQNKNNDREWISIKITIQSSCPGKTPSASASGADGLPAGKGSDFANNAAIMRRSQAMKYRRASRPR